MEQINDLRIISNEPINFDSYKDNYMQTHVHLMCMIR